MARQRLALRVAAQRWGAFPDGTWLVELGALGNGELVAAEVASQLGILEESGADATELIVASFAKRRCLILLDCCEHLLDPVASLVNRLLKAGDGSRVLATRREPLGVAGETPRPVLPLSIPPRQLEVVDLVSLEEFDTARLFIVEPVRRLASSPAIAMPERSRRSAVASTASHLRSSWPPLAPASSRPASSPTAWMTGSALLTNGERTALPRHRTLRATVEWSYDLLTSTEQAVFDRLSVFAGLFGLDDAEEVCADDTLGRLDVVDAVASLVNKSLLVRADTDLDSTSYRLLDTIRQFAGERLVASSAEDAVRERHAAHYLSIAGTMGPLVRGPQARTRSTPARSLPRRPPGGALLVAVELSR